MRSREPKTQRTNDVVGTTALRAHADLNLVFGVGPNIGLLAILDRPTREFVPSPIGMAAPTSDVIWRSEKRVKDWGH